MHATSNGKLSEVIAKFVVYLFPHYCDTFFIKIGNMYRRTAKTHTIEENFSISIISTGRSMENL